MLLFKHKDKKMGQGVMTWNTGKRDMAERKSQPKFGGELKAYPRLAVTETYLCIRTENSSCKQILRAVNESLLIMFKENKWIPVNTKIACNRKYTHTQIVVIAKLHKEPC